MAKSKEELNSKEFIAALENLFNTSLPREYAAFITNISFADFQGGTIPAVSLNRKIYFNRFKDIETVFDGGPWDENSFLYKKKKLIYMPIAKLSMQDGISSADGESSLRFFAIDISRKGCPVIEIYLEHDLEKITPVASSVLELVKMIVPPGGNNPVKDLKKNLQKLKKEAKKPGKAEEALKLSDQLILDYQNLSPQERKSLKKCKMEIHYMRGLLIKNLRGMDEAVPDFEEALKLNSTDAGYELCDFHLSNGRPGKARTILEAERFWAKNSTFDYRMRLGTAFILLKRKEDAVKIFTKIHRRNLRDHPELTDRAVAQLAQLPGPVAKDISQWFGQKTDIKVNKKEIVANRTWWDRLSREVREKLLEELRLGKDDTPTDMHIAEMLNEINSFIIFDLKAKDLRLLRRLKKLDTLRLVGAEKKAFQIVSEFTGLKVLDFEKSNISDPGPLELLVKLEELQLDGNRITSVEAIGHLKELRELSLKDNPVMDLSPLAKLTKLTRLNIKRSSAKNIKSLGKLQNLKTLFMDEVPVSDLSPLKNHPALERIYLDDCSNISDLSPLVSCPALKKVGARGLDKEVISAFKKERPKVKIEK